MRQLRGDVVGPRPHPSLSSSKAHILSSNRLIHVSQWKTERGHPAGPTIGASRYYQVDLSFLTLVRNTAFYSQRNSHLLLHLYSPPPGTFHGWAGRLCSKVPPALAGRQQMKLATFFPAGCQHTAPTPGKWPLARLGRDSTVRGPVCSPSASAHRLPIRTPWHSSWHRAWWVRCFPCHCDHAG